MCLAINYAPINDNPHPLVGGGGGGDIGDFSKRCVENPTPGAHPMSIHL